MERVPIACSSPPSSTTRLPDPACSAARPPCRPGKANARTSRNAPRRGLCHLRKPRPSHSGSMAAPTASARSRTLPDPETVRGADTDAARVGDTSRWHKPRVAKPVCARNSCVGSHNVTRVAAFSAGRGCTSFTVGADVTCRATSRCDWLGGCDAMSRRSNRPSTRGVSRTEPVPMAACRRELRSWAWRGKRSSEGGAGWGSVVSDMAYSDPVI